ncbi:hypothetical protein ORI89_14775 [Sphingobacterium sp. UT-1RO-CII-1]|uniref:hypothetical protein n=1 Tax=Sphingobacterium sp. UT-1RO-CII-1 TaxID=2995225 RepID=UPI00227BDBCD|nr:hypothetical protein [Sphingobacterium sp. UT-1RO-CII-1]MCY4780921.1 hypothetical protein [Sphingobacterium sp. UT-1RO-CII-1]
MKRIVILILLLSLIGQSHGQKREKVVVPFLTNVTLDADLSEWSLLNKVGVDEGWSYQIGYDRENVYFAVEVKDHDLQNLAIRYGVGISFLRNSRKEKDQQFIYPCLDQETLRALRSEGEEPDMNRSLIKRVRGYYVRGLRDIPDGLLSFQNNYGLQAVVKTLDDKLWYEAVVPRKQLLSTDGLLVIKLEINEVFSLRSGAVSKRPATMTRRTVLKKDMNKTPRQVIVETILDQ